MRSALRKALRAFGHFWLDFLIGDTPELALATGLIVGLAFAVDHNRLAGTLLLPAVAAAFLLLSTLRGRRRPSED
jgi:hypothetical protein